MRWFGRSPASATLRRPGQVSAQRPQPPVSCRPATFSTSRRGVPSSRWAILLTPESGGQAGSRLRSGRLGASFRGSLTPESGASKFGRGRRRLSLGAGPGRLHPPQGRSSLPRKKPEPLRDAPLPRTGAWELRTGCSQSPRARGTDGALVQSRGGAEGACRQRPMGGRGAGGGRCLGAGGRRRREPALQT